MTQLVLQESTLGTSCIMRQEEGNYVKVCAAFTPFGCKVKWMKGFVVLITVNSKFHCFFFTVELLFYPLNLHLAVCFPPSQDRTPPQYFGYVQILVLPRYFGSSSLFLSVIYKLVPRMQSHSLFLHHHINTFIVLACRYIVFSLVLLPSKSCLFKSRTVSYITCGVWVLTLCHHGIGGFCSCT